ncbi:MAG: hypothetical protein IKH15_08165 [Bacteroidales bacterium]|nr:hypothetical protein [Bacteroidales bacterium]MBR4637060.1 hypothetical protein [Bacteroidales bacterium]
MHSIITRNLQKFANFQQKLHPEFPVVLCRSKHVRPRRVLAVLVVLDHRAVPDQSGPVVQQVGEREMKLRQLQASDPVTAIHRLGVLLWVCQNVSPQGRPQPLLDNRLLDGSDGELDLGIPDVIGRGETRFQKICSVN